MNISNINQTNEPNLDINLNAIKGFLTRNKKLIIYSIISILFPSLVYSSIRKPTYEGTFQIVLSNNTNNLMRKASSAKESLLNEYEGISDFLNISTSGSKKLETEVKILESPLILMPSYEYVKKFLKENGNNVKNLTFDKWKKNLNVSLLRKTSVLEISYRDKNRDLISQVLNLISKDYQKYSGRDRLRSIDNGINYLEDQIKIIKEQSRDAYKKAFIFALKNNLDTNIIKERSRALIPLGIENNANNAVPDKYKASIELKFIEKQLENLKNVNDNNANQIIYDIPNKNDLLYLQLLDLDKSIIKAKTTYVESDYYLKNLIKKRKILRDTIIQNTKNSLESQKLRYQSLLTSLDRPNEILIKDRELKKEANRLLNIYDEMTSNLQSSKLEKVKKLDPWELISNPRLKEDPVGLRNLYLPFIGILFGAFLGLLIAKIIEDKEGIIFDLQTFNQMVGLKKLCELSINKKNTWQQYIELICQKQYDPNKNSNLNLIYLGNSISHKNEINNLFFKSSKEISVDNNLDKNYSHILIVESGSFNKFDLFTFQEQINLVEVDIIGFIFIY